MSYARAIFEIANGFRIHTATYACVPKFSCPVAKWLCIGGSPYDGCALQSSHSNERGRWEDARGRWEDARGRWEEAPRRWEEARAQAAVQPQRQRPVQGSLGHDWNEVPETPVGRSLVVRDPLHSLVPEDPAQAVPLVPVAHRGRICLLIRIFDGGFSRCSGFYPI